MPFDVGIDLQFFFVCHPFSGHQGSPAVGCSFDFPPYGTHRCFHVKTGKIAVLFSVVPDGLVIDGIETVVIFVDPGGTAQISVKLRTGHALITAGQLAIFKHFVIIPTLDPGLPDDLTAGFAEADILM